MNNNRGHWEVELRMSSTPEELWKNAVDYFKWCDKNPITPKKTVMTGKEAGKQVDVQLIRPYTVKALCLHCGITEEYLKDMRDAPKDSVAYLVVSRILMNIWVQNAEMAMVGEFNPVFTAKMLNIDTEDNGPQKVVIEYIGDLPQLSNSENEILGNVDLKNGNLEIVKEKNSKGTDGSISM